MRLHHYFEWDPEKAKSNAQKHRATFDDAAAVLGDEQADRFHVERIDDEHSTDEERSVTIGSDPQDRTIIPVICWTERRKKGRSYTRIISARRATMNERMSYVKALRRGQDG